MLIRCELNFFLVLAIGCHSNHSENDVLLLKKDLQMCKLKLTQAQTLHKQDKSRLKVHLKNTRHNNQVQGSESPKICLVLVPFFSASSQNVLVLVPYFSALALSTKITKI